jgi:hypothetical protein
MPKKDEQTKETTAAAAIPKKRATKRANSAASESTAPGSEVSPLELLTEETLLQFEFTPDAIATRAYFLAEKRRAQGLHPDPVQDWLLAEREILSALEGSAKPAKKTRARKAK